MGINYSTSLKDKFVDTVDKFHTNMMQSFVLVTIGVKTCKTLNGLIIYLF